MPVSKIFVHHLTEGTGLQKDRFINKTVLLGIGESILPARVKPGGGDFEVLSGSDVGVFESSQRFLGIIFTIKAIIKIKVVGIEDYYAILETGHKELYAYWLCCR